jgi:hypothetical protein
MHVLCVVFVQIDESAIIESLELACNPAKPDGQWITHYDMLEDGDRIKLVDTKQVSCLQLWSGVSKCVKVCQTLAKCVVSALAEESWQPVDHALRHAGRRGQDKSGGHKAGELPATKSKCQSVKVYNACLNLSLILYVSMCMLCGHHSVQAQP